MHQAAIVTGATGFLGSHLAAGILSRDADVTVICVSRPKEGRTARERVLEALARAHCDGNGHSDQAEWAERVVVIEEDLCAHELSSIGIAGTLGRAFQINEF
jgi:thioester reductase-like protein